MSNPVATGRCFSPGTPVSSTNKTDIHDITEILLKVALNTITHRQLQTVLKTEHVRDVPNILNWSNISIITLGLQTGPNTGEDHKMFP